jgi:diguanylate cyclase (GGDEF)-like protein/PAS domain S-box-containing protein
MQTQLADSMVDPFAEHYWSAASMTGADRGFFKRVLEASTIPILVFKLHADYQLIEYANPAFARCVGCHTDEFRGRDWRELLSTPGVEVDLHRVFKEMERGRELPLVLLCHRKDGTPFWSELRIASLGSNQYVGMLRDVTVERSHRELLEHKAHHDALTGLPNRLLLKDRFEQHLAHARRGNGNFAVAVVDIDNFKAVNDTLGHQAGDALLQEIAGRLTRFVRVGDTVARVGGDEFVLLLQAIDDCDAFASSIARLKIELQQPASLQGKVIIVSCSVGISVYPSDGADETTLLSNADRAMYQGKVLRQSGDAATLSAATTASAQSKYKSFPWVDRSTMTGWCTNAE